MNDSAFKLNYVENYRWFKVQSLSVVYSGLGDIAQHVSNICFRYPLCPGYHWMQMLLLMVPFYS